MIDTRAHSSNISDSSATPRVAGCCSSIRSKRSACLPVAESRVASGTSTRVLHRYQYPQQSRQLSLLDVRYGILVHIQPGCYTAYSASLLVLPTTNHPAIRQIPVSLATAAAVSPIIARFVLVALHAAHPSTLHWINDCTDPCTRLHRGSWIGLGSFSSMTRHLCPGGDATV